MYVSAYIPHLEVVVALLEEHTEAAAAEPEHGDTVAARGAQLHSDTHERVVQRYVTEVHH